MRRSPYTHSVMVLSTKRTTAWLGMSCGCRWRTHVTTHLQNASSKGARRLCLPGTARVSSGLMPLTEGGNFGGGLSPSLPLAPLVGRIDREDAEMGRSVGTRSDKRHLRPEASHEGERSG